MHLLIIRNNNQTTKTEILHVTITFQLFDWTLSIILLQQLNHNLNYFKLDCFQITGCICENLKLLNVEHTQLAYSVCLLSLLTITQSLRHLFFSSLN